MAKDKFIIEPHFRLQEWVAEEKGYFKDEGLDYMFREMVQSSDGGRTSYKGDKVGAMQSFEAGRTSNVSCACHWTVNVAASKGKGKLYGEVYSVSPCGIFVPADSPMKKPEDLAGVPISVGYQSGSHYATIQALEPYMAARQDQSVRSRTAAVRPLDNLIEGKVPACTLFSGPVLLGRAARLPQGARLHLHDRHHDQRRAGPGGREEVLQRAAPRATRHRSAARSLHALLQERIPAALHATMDTRRWGPGERMVFEPYTKETYEETFKWIADHGIFADTGMGNGRYEDAVIRA